MTVNVKPNTDLADVFVKHWHGKNTDEFESERVFSFPIINKPEPGAFSKAFLDKKEIENRLNLLNQMSIAFGTVEKLPSDFKNFKPIEAALIVGLRDFYHRKNNGKPLLMKLKKEQKFRRDIPIGAISKYPTVSFNISHLQDSSVVGLIPQELLDIKEYRL